MPATAMPMRTCAVSSLKPGCNPKRTIVVGHASAPRVRAQVGTWSRAALGTAGPRDLAGVRYVVLPAGAAPMWPGIRLPLMTREG